jgi:hypothetical protein
MFTANPLGPTEVSFRPVPGFSQQALLEVLSELVCE